LFSTTLLQTKTSTNSRAAETQPALKKKNVNPIIGGQEVEESRWPFMARIISNSDGELHLCGGTLIAPGWVLTAKHCVVDENGDLLENKNILVQVGPEKKDIQDVVIARHEKNYSDFLSGTVKGVYSFSDTNTHLSNTEDKGVFKYMYSPNKNGIALIQLIYVPHDTTGKALDTISLVNAEKVNSNRNGQMTVSMGYGRTIAIDSHSHSEILMQAVLPISNQFKDEFNNDIDSPQKVLQDFEYIVGYPLGKVSQCYGDSGGPNIVWNGEYWVQAGVVLRHNVNKLCGDSNDFNVLAKLSYTDANNSNLSYINWIKDTINREGFPVGVSSTYIYNGRGTFIGVPLPAEETKEYYSRICDKAEWGNNLPEICPLNIYHGH